MRPRGLARIAPGLLAAALLLPGCATIQTARGGPGQKVDPWENWNRKVFAFNEGLDAKVLKPVATAYSKLVPQPVRQGVDNFAGVASDAWSVVNNTLQGKFAPAVDSLFRVVANTMFGLFVIDVATDLGIERQTEDFGQTLGRWGFGPGAYIVWPLFGGSTLRDSIGLPLDRAVSPAMLIHDGTLVWSITALQLINTRANLLGASRVLDDIALDKYTFLRDAYLQRRRSLVYDGDAPTEPDPDVEPAKK